jgi:hypothetical protein
VPARALLVRVTSALLVLLLAVLAAVGGVSMGVSALICVVLAAVVTACIAAGIARDGNPVRPRQAAVDAAWRTASGTVAALLVISGCVVLAGGAVAAVSVGLVLAGVLARFTLREVRRGRAGGSAAVIPLPAAGAPVQALTVEALGREWLRTSSDLDLTREPSARRALVDRRQEALDELERRDPVGFARWLAEGATVDSDPARYVSADPATGHEAA